MAKSITVRFANFQSNDNQRLFEEIENIVDSGVIGDEQAIKKSGDLLLFAFNRGRDLNSTIRKSDGTDDELIPPEGSRATETMYFMIDKSSGIMAFTGTQYFPGPARFIDYYKKLYKSKRNKKPMDFQIIEIYNRDILEALKNSEWTSFDINVIVAQVPEGNDLLYGEYILKGLKLLPKTIRLGMTGDITRTIKEKILRLIDYCSSASARSADKKIGRVNLKNCRFAYNVKIPENQSVCNCYKEVLVKALDEYKKGFTGKEISI